MFKKVSLIDTITIICPNCKSKNVVKKGQRKGKFRIKSLYYCKDCNKRFADQALNLKNKIYNPWVIIYAINCYNLGNTFSQSSKKVNAKYKVKTSKSTIHFWVNEYKNFCPVLSMRQNFAGYDDYQNVLFTKRFEHENLDYLFMYHKYKLDALSRSSFFGLAKYITDFEKGCPNVFFEVGSRCSNPLFDVKVKAKKQVNLACRMAGFAVNAARKNIQRHKIVEEFMVINDAATIACEVPVWYWDKKVDAGVTGHIDMIQIRNNLVYVVDYKPNASKDKNAASQLYHYALALSYRTRLPLSSIRCAWFDKDSYYEYAPLNAGVETKKYLLILK